MQRFWAWHIQGLGYFPFARRYLENHFCFLFLRVLRCFSSPRLPLHPMYSDVDDKVLTLPGCPIQTSPDQSLFSSSPKLFAAYHVFLRLLIPRHPPFALYSLATIFYYNLIRLNALMRLNSEFSKIILSQTIACESKKTNKFISCLFVFLPLFGGG